MIEEAEPHLSSSGEGSASPETVEAVLADIIPPGHRCRPVETTDRHFDRLLAAIERSDTAQAKRMPDVRAALDQMFDAFDRLRKLGWRDAIYCPKDGTVFESISAGSTGIRDCHYEGEWPKGSWWTHDDGDLWPSRPILFRLKGSDTSMGIPVDPSKASRHPVALPREGDSRPNTNPPSKPREES